MPSRSSSRQKILSVCRDLFQVSQTQAKHLQTSEAQTKQGQAIVLKACSHLKLHIKSVSRFKPFHVARAQGADFSPSEICKATLSVEMGRKTKTMKTVQQNPPEIAYRRNDGDSFTYRCKLEGERVIWRTFLSDTGEWGRWRQQYSEGDAMTTYSVSNGKLTIMNDQTDTETFRKSDF